MATFSERFASMVEEIVDDLATHLWSLDDANMFSCLPWDCMHDMDKEDDEEIVIDDLISYLRSLTLEDLVSMAEDVDKKREAEREQSKKKKEAATV
jgi:hypothetical protein